MDSVDIATIRQDRIVRLGCTLDLDYADYKSPYEFDIMSAVDRFQAKFDSMRNGRVAFSHKERNLLKTYVGTTREYDCLVDSAYKYYFGIGFEKDIKQAYYRFCLLVGLRPDIWQNVCIRVYAEIR